MAKDLNITVLLDFYGEMLTDKQRDIIESYYCEDLSLGEIAEELNITRQGVRDSVKRSEQQLTEMEDKLGLAKRFKKVQDNLSLICDCALNIKEISDDDDIYKNVEAIIDAAKELVE